jgi:predicted PurR-regulated permease PerM
MTPGTGQAPGRLENRALWLLLAAVSFAFVWILLPFYGTLLWAAIIAVVFAPLYRGLLRRLRRRRTPAALLTLAIVLVSVVLPLALITASLAREATLVYERVQSGEWNPVQYFQGVFDALPRWVLALLDRFGLADFATVQRRLTAALAEGSRFVATHALAIGQNTFEFVAALFITLYLAFFLVRDGEPVARNVRRALPLADAQQQQLVDKFTTVIRATVKGHLLVAAVQGALGGLAFWVLGVGAALLWGVLMAFLSLVPVVGAALVWVPVAVYLAVTGAVLSSLALVAFGVLVIGLVDNLLRPMLVGKDTHLPDALVMITTLGGVATFGVNGLVLGPAIAAMFVAVWHIHAGRPD